MNLYRVEGDTLIVSLRTEFADGSAVIEECRLDINSEAGREALAFLRRTNKNGKPEGIHNG